MSEQTLDGLIAKVKTEAIEVSEKEAKKIIDEAKKEAQDILTKAKAQKESIISEAQVESKALVEKGKVALDQAVRDVQISVKNDIQELFKSVLETKVQDAFTPDLYASVIAKVMDGIGKNVTFGLPEDMKDQLVNSIRKSIAESKLTPEIIKKENLLSGLSVAKTDEGWSYDITADEISELLSQHLSQKWVELLNLK